MATVSTKKAFFPVFLAFLIINALLIAGKNLLLERDISQTILLVGNTIIFILTGISYRMHTAALHKNTSMGFVNAVYGGMLVKMFGCVIAAFVYILSVKHVNKPALFGCMFFYLLYTFLETKIVTRLNSLQKKNA